MNCIEPFPPSGWKIPVTNALMIFSKYFSFLSFSIWYVIEKKVKKNNFKCSLGKKSTPAQNFLLVFNKGPFKCTKVLEVIFDYLWWCQLTSKEWLICKTCLKIWKGNFYKLSSLQSVLALKRVWWENANLIFFTALLPTCKMFLSLKCRRTWLW